MNNQGHHETITLRMSPNLLAAIDDATEKLKLTSLMKLPGVDDYVPTRSATMRFLIQVGINYLQNRPFEKGPRTGKKTTLTP